MTAAQRRAVREEWRRFGIDAGGVWDLDALFGRHAPRVLEIGAGFEGESLGIFFHEALYRIVGNFFCRFAFFHLVPGDLAPAALDVVTEAAHATQAVDLVVEIVGAVGHDMQLARVRLEMGEAAAAKKSLRTVTTLDPSRVDVLEELAAEVLVRAFHPGDYEVEWSDGHSNLPRGVLTCRTTALTGVKSA